MSLLCSKLKRGGTPMGKKDLAEKNLMQYKDVFSDVVNVNIFGGKHFISENDLLREPTEMITHSLTGGNLESLHMDVPMCCQKDGEKLIIFWLENQSDINNAMPVRDMGYQYAKYREQIRDSKAKRKEKCLIPHLITKELQDDEKLYPVITLVLNYSQQKWEQPQSVKDMIAFPEKYRDEITPWISEHQAHIINLAEQPEETIKKYRSDFRYLVRYLACHNDKQKLDKYFQETEFDLDHPEAFLDWLSAMTNDTRYRKAKKMIEKQKEGGRINMCVLLDMYEERGEERGLKRGREEGLRILLQTCQSLSIPRKDVKRRIMEGYTFSSEEAEEMLVKYWG